MKRYKIICAVVGSVLLSGCLNNDFLEKVPLDQPTEETAFVSYDNFKTYAWGLYEVFPGYNQNLGLYGEENPTDNISYNASVSSESPWITNSYTEPNSGGGWNFTYIRRVNLMLDNIEGAAMTGVEKEHWRSVGYFFRAYRYAELIVQFGDVPWVDHVISETETGLIFGKRDARDVVAKQVLEDLQYAEQHVKPGGDGENTVNTDVVRALLSRFALFEGTWRKYHGLKDADVYLKECARASQACIKENPEVHQNYDEVFCSQDLSGVTGVLLYKQYVKTKKTHSISILGTTENANYNVTKDAVDSYLCLDGKTRWTSPIFVSDTNIYEEFRNRDYRLLFTVCPPYRIIVYGDGGAYATQWKYTDDPRDREYMDLMETLVNNPRNKRLPMRANYEGGVMKQVPHFAFYQNGQVWFRSQLGYNIWKYYHAFNDLGPQRDEDTDAPVFRMGEVMLNYAEAKFELGEFDQSVADMTINKLRPRAGVAPMMVSAIDASFDPNRDPSVDPVLWEIRRERRVELFAEGFRFDDLRRWKKCDYALKKKLGQWVNKANFPAGTRINIDGGGTQGYLAFHEKPSHSWPAYYYLYPLPVDQLTLNENLEQNEGWRKSK